MIQPNRTVKAHCSLLRLLADLIRQAPVENRPFTAIDLDGEELRGIEVRRREWQGIDLLITCTQPNCVVVIENKIDSDEHSDQLRRYENAIAKHFPNAGGFLFT